MNTSESRKPVWRSSALFVVLALLVGLAVSSAFAQGAGLQRFEAGEIEIVSPDRSHKFSIEHARTPQQQAQGLMFRRRLAADAGMLFTYQSPQIILMWMKNTYIPLDMIFIGADLRVVSVAERTTPRSLETISSQKPAIAVLEVNGGTVRKLGIRTGDRVRTAFLAAR